MKARMPLGIVLLAAIAGAAVPAAGAEVHFLDANMEQVVRDELGIPPPAPITDADMLSLISLHSQGSNISSLVGLEYAANLDALALNINDIEDISALSGLVKLRYLSMARNRIKDITPVSGLAGLDFLHFGGNDISDISAVSGLRQLYDLHLGNNCIKDISPLSGLSASGTSNLMNLMLFENEISDISVFAGSNLPRMRSLWLSDNEISDISPLTGLVGLEILDLAVNPLNQEAYTTHLPLIEANNPGILLFYDPIPEPATLALLGIGLVVLAWRKRRAAHSGLVVKERLASSTVRGSPPRRRGGRR